ncbi:MAG: hypothetical protein WC479_08755, partial [Candidatus Izemoplasmatales bacterium]
MSAVTLGSAGLVPSITVGGIEHDILHHGGALSVHIGGGSRDGGNIIAAGGVTAASTGTVIFSNDNNVSFGLVGSVVTASVDISAAASSDHTHGPIFTTSITGDVLTHSSTNNGLILGVPEWLTTAAQTDHTHGTINFGATTNSTETAIRFSSASDGLTMVQPSFLTTAASISHTHNYAGTGTSTGTISSNLVRVTLNTDGLSLRIPNYLTTYAGGYDLTVGGTNTSGTLTLVSSGTVTLAGGNNITLSQAGNAITIVGPNTYGSASFVGTETSVTTVSGTDLLLSADTAGISVSHPDWQTTGINMSVGGTNTLGTLENISNSTVILYGGDNITLSQDNNSITIIGTDNYSAIKGIGAQGSTFSSGTVHLSAQTNIQLQTYLDGVSQYVRFSVPDFAGTTTAATNVGLTVNSAGIRVSLDTAGIGALGDGVNIFAASDVTAGSAGTVILSNSNGINFGMSTITGSNFSTITASYTQSTHEHPYIASQSTSVFAYTSNSSLLQHTSATSAITLSALNTSQSTLFQHTSATSNITGNALNTSQSTLFEHTSHTSAITASAVNTSLTSQWLTTAALSTHTHGGVSLSLSNLTGTYSSASNGLTISLTNTFTASQSIQTQGMVSINGSTGNISLNTGSSLSSSANASGITFGLASNISTAWSNQRVYYDDGTTLITSGSVRLQGTNITPSISYDTLGFHTFYFSAADPNTAGGTGTLATTNISGTLSSSNGNWTMSLNYPASSNFVNSSETGSVYFSSANGISFGSSADSNSTTITGSYAQNYYLTGTNTSGASSFSGGSNLSISAGNNITLSVNTNNQLVINAGGGSVENNWLNLAGNTSSNSTASGSTILLSAGNNVTLAATNGSVIRIDAAAGGNLVLKGSGTYTQNTGTIGFLNSNNVTFGLTAGTMTASIPSGTVFFSDTNGISFSSSTVTGSASVS